MAISQFAHTPKPHRGCTSATLVRRFASDGITYALTPISRKRQIEGAGGRQPSLREIFKSSSQKAALRPLTQIPFPWGDFNRIYYTTGAKKSTVKRHGFAEIFHADSKKGAYFRLHAFIMYLQWGDTLPAMRVFTAYFTMKRPFRAARRTRLPQTPLPPRRGGLRRYPPKRAAACTPPRP